VAAEKLELRLFCRFRMGTCYVGRIWSRGICGGSIMQTLSRIWEDSVWSKVIGAAIFALCGAIVGSVSASFRKNWWPHVRKLTVQSEPAFGVVEVNAKENAGEKYPLKCYVILRNDSAFAIDLTVSNYEPLLVKLKSFRAACLRLKLGGNTVPAGHVDRIAVYPGQQFEAWVGVDETKFSADQVNSHIGNIGKLVLAANGKVVRVQF
jgi:hypothetical protein